MRLHMVRAEGATLNLSTKRRRALGKVLRTVQETKCDGRYPGLSDEETRDADCILADMTRFCDVQEGAQ